MSAGGFWILGFGNLLREDDGAGARALEGLEPPGPDVAVEVVPELVPELAEELADLEGVVFVDAGRRGAPGEVRCEALAAGGASSPPGSHALDPASLLEYTERLYGRRPKAVLVTVAGRSFGFGTGLSEEVFAALPRARERILSAIEAWRGESRRRPPAGP